MPLLLLLLLPTLSVVWCCLLCGVVCCVVCWRQVAMLGALPGELKRAGRTLEEFAEHMAFVWSFMFQVGARGESSKCGGMAGMRALHATQGVCLLGMRRPAHGCAPLSLKNTAHITPTAS
jgi:hypothetical protein